MYIVIITFGGDYFVRSWIIIYWHDANIVLFCREICQCHRRRIHLTYINFRIGEILDSKYMFNTLSARYTILRHRCTTIILLIHLFAASSVEKKYQERTNILILYNMHIKKAINSFNNFLEPRKSRDQSTNRNYAEGPCRHILICVSFPRE